MIVELLGCGLIGAAHLAHLLPTAPCLGGHTLGILHKIHVHGIPIGRSFGQASSLCFWIVVAVILTIDIITGKDIVGFVTRVSVAVRMKSTISISRSVFSRKKETRWGGHQRRH